MTKNKTLFAMITFPKIMDWIHSLIMVTVGAILFSLPILFWDFLVYEQFKPTVRPFYPVFYGAFFIAGAVLILLGVFGFIKKKNLNESLGNLFSNYVIPLFAIVVGIGLFTGSFELYNTTEYLAADGLFYMILTAPLLGTLLLVLLVSSGLSVIINTLRKRAVSAVSRRASASVVVVVLMGVIIGGVLSLPPDAELKPFPEDVPFVTSLYAQGEAGYNTFKIPTMITAPNGTILSFAEARTEHKDDWSKTDVVLRKSYDLGTTWTALEVLIEEGDMIIGNACPVVDRNTGIIWLIFCKQNDRAFKMYSEDNGETWSEPVEITQDVKLDHWTWYATGPSHGIQLKDGTLVIPADHIENRKMMAHVIYSRDGGNTWQLGGTVPGGEEATLVELDNGDLYINIRPVRPGHRVTAISHDKGLTWTEISHDTSLPDPACQGNLIEIEKNEGSLYLFTNPADSLHREMMTVRLSDDECKTWSKSKILYEGMASYSALSLIDAENDIIGCIFERGANFYAEEIVFMRFPLSYLDQ